MKIRDDFFRSHENLTTANAIAAIMRRHAKPIQWAQAEWGLTEGEARGALYAQASRATVDKIIRHRNGGWSVLLAIGEAVIGEPLETHLRKLERERDIERQHAENQRVAIAATIDRLGAVRARMAAR